MKLRYKSDKIRAKILIFSGKACVNDNHFCKIQSIKSNSLSNLLYIENARYAVPELQKCKNFLVEDLSSYYFTLSDLYVLFFYTVHVACFGLQPKRKITVTQWINVCMKNSDQLISGSLRQEIELFSHLVGL